APDDGRSRRRQRELDDAHHASRSRPRARQCISLAAPQRLAQDIRESVAALSECLSRTARKPRLRAASRSLVRAKPPDRRLRRNVCRLATTQGALAARISKLAGARKARVRRL